MKVSYLFFLVIALACERGNTNHQQEANAVRDLLIDRTIWKSLAVPNQPGVQLNQHQFSITNTSSQHSYRQIQVRFDYYDDKYRRVGSTRYVIPQVVEPRSAVAISPVQVGKTHPLTKSATVNVEQALSD